MMKKKLTPEQTAWKHMIQRCENPNHPKWKHYGGRGIKIHPEWRKSFKAFFEYIGPRPSNTHSLDRYPNNDGNYEPGNIRWATPNQQARNTRQTVMLEFNGVKKSARDWLDHFGLSYKTFQGRVQRLGWSVERAISEQPDRRFRPKHLSSPSFVLSQKFQNFDSWLAGDKADPLTRARDVCDLFRQQKRGDLVSEILVYVAGGFDGGILNPEQYEALKVLSNAVKEGDRK